VVLNSGGKKTRRTRKEKKNVPKIVATFIYASQGQHMHSARTKTYDNPQCVRKAAWWNIT
jgi:hypothetical protein